MKDLDVRKLTAQPGFREDKKIEAMCVKVKTT
jgi:hypothetical protein